jgi:type II secretory pathway pseudopilin PulG
MQLVRAWVGLRITEPLALPLLIEPGVLRALVARLGYEWTLTCRRTGKKQFSAASPPARAQAIGIQMNKIIAVLAVSLLGISVAQAATISAASCAATDVQNALNLAQAGDTVLLPAGTASWTQRVTWNAPANVTLKGAGTSATGGGDQTTITDDVGGGNHLFNIHAASTGVLRITGITFRSGGGGIKDNGTINFEGPGMVRIDHCHLIATSGSNYKMMRFGSGVFGVMDHCILDFRDLNALYFYNGRCGVGDWMGNYEWSLPTEFGSANYFYIEDNIINGNLQHAHL